MFTGFQRTFHLLIITSSDYNLQCLSVSIHYLLLQLLIQIRTECLPLIIVRLFYHLNYVRCLHLMYLKNGIHRKNRTYPRRFGVSVACLGTLADVEMVAYAGAAPATPE